MQIFCIQFTKRGAKSPPSGVERLATSGCTSQKGRQNDRFDKNLHLLGILLPTVPEILRQEEGQDVLC